jgi:hypothetical protein
MAYYATGRDFEEAVFGHHSDNPIWNWRPRRKKTAFGKDLKEVICSAKIKHPPTKIGECLYRQVARQLSSLKINPEGLVFLSSINTKADFFHGTDGFFFLPSLFPHLVTVDVFNLNPRGTFSLTGLRESWIDSFSGEFYSEADFQSDMFLLKTGMLEWKAAHKNFPAEFCPDQPPDFREFAVRGREENHFVLTPLHVSTYRRRREFAKLVAGYFAKVSGASNHKMALLSH